MDRAVTAGIGMVAIVVCATCTFMATGSLWAGGAAFSGLYALACIADLYK